MEPNQLIDRLATFEPTEFPFVSLYLNTQPNETGRENYDSFVRKQFNEMAKTFPARTPAQESFTQDAERINSYLETELQKSAQGLAIFACHGAEFFEAIPLDTPIERHRLSVSDFPDIYPLARLVDQYKRYAVVVLDSNTARIFVFGLGSQQEQETVVMRKPIAHKLAVGHRQGINATMKIFSCITSKKWLRHWNKSSEKNKSNIFCWQEMK